jgi:uncharacterized protein (TIGR00369 family)
MSDETGRAPGGDGRRATARETFGEYRYCFACGRDNPFGLRVEPERGEETWRIAWTPRAEYEGYEGVLHGGIVATLLDEAMAYAAISVAARAATAEMQVRFLKPVSVTEPLVIEGEVVEKRRRVLSTAARLVQGGETRATATGKFVVTRVSARTSG